MKFVAHSGFVVTDLDRATRFYCEVLGFERCRTLAMPSEHVSDFLALDPPGGNLKAVYLMLGDFQLELMQFSPPGGNRICKRKMNEVGLTHISIGVESVASVIARLGEFGAELVSQLGDKAAMLRDPDGQFVEILESTYAAEERLRRD